MIDDYQHEMEMMLSMRFLREHLRRSEIIASKLTKYPGFNAQNVFLQGDIDDIERLHSMTLAFTKMNAELALILEKYDRFHDMDSDDFDFFLDESEELSYLVKDEGE